MNAQFSDDRVYRYSLTRLVPVTFSFEPRPFTGRTVMFIGLNPSTADETNDDPTIRRLIDFASRWGFTRMFMTNLFAFRATDPRVMKAYQEPIGAENDHWLRLRGDESDLIVACWGNDGEHLGRGAAVMQMFPNMHAFRVTKIGQPEHPLYMKATTIPTPLNARSHIATGRGG